MRRGGRRSKTGALLAGGAAVVVSLLANARAASAAGCQGRPTDAAGFQGYSYGAEPVKSFATARVRVHYATTGTQRGRPDHDARRQRARHGGARRGRRREGARASTPRWASSSRRATSPCTSNGGDDKLDVYLVAFTGADGTTIAESCTGRSCSSFVLVEATFSGRGYPSVAEGFRTVVAHELFHSVQDGYDSELDRFWAEGTAQWAMKNVFPELVDFEQQLPAFFKDPTRSLDTQPSGVTAGFLYGSAVWPLFLTLRHGPDTVREILEKELDGTKSLAATDAVLMGKGSSIAEDYPLFGAWNTATKTLAGTGGYPDAAKYPGVKLATLAEGATGITSGLSYYSYRATLDAPSKVSVETDATRNAAVGVPIVGGQARPDEGREAPREPRGRRARRRRRHHDEEDGRAVHDSLGAPDPDGDVVRRHVGHGGDERRRRRRRQRRLRDRGHGGLRPVASSRCVRGARGGARRRSSSRDVAGDEPSRPRGRRRSRARGRRGGLRAERRREPRARHRPRVVGNHPRHRLGRLAGRRRAGDALRRDPDRRRRRGLQRHAAHAEARAHGAALRRHDRRERRL